MSAASSARDPASACGLLAFGVAINGACVAASSGADISPLAFIAIACLLQGVGMAVVVRAGGWPRRRPPMWLLGPIVAVDLLQFSAYLASLRLGPVGPCAALHLCSPLALMAWEIVRGRRRPRWRDLTVVALLGAGAVAAGLSQGDDSGPAPAIGLTLAALSAVGMACLYTLINRASQAMTLQWANALKSLWLGVLCLPALLIAPPSASGAGVAAVVGLVGFTASGMLVWKAISRLRPRVSLALSLLEAPATATAALVLWARPMPAAQVIAGTLMLAAVWMEARRD